MQVYLGVGMGASDRLDLTGGTNYVVLDDGFRVDDDAADRRYVYVTLHLHLRGATKGALLNARRAILTKLNQATIGGDGINDWVMLGVKFTNATQMVWWHVVEGGITEPGALRTAGNYIGATDAPLVLTLRCHKGAFGEPIIDDAVTITGNDPVLYRAGVPGDLPAYVEAVVTDTSVGDVVLHGIGIGSRSAMDMDAGDFVPFQPVEAVGIGSTEGDEEEPVADSFTGEIVTASPGLNWQQMAAVMPLEAQMRGAYDLWLRVRDDSHFLDAPQGLNATGVEGASLRQTITSRSNNKPLEIEQATLPGNTLILMVHLMHRTGTPSVTAVPPGFTLVRSQDANSGHALIAMYVYANAPVHTGTLDISAANTNSYGLILTEWTNLTSSPLDVTTSNATSSTTAHSTGTTSATAVANAVVITAHLVSGTTTNLGGYTAGYTQVYSRTLQVTPSPFIYAFMHSRYRMLTATGSQSATLTSKTSGYGANLIAVFSAESGGELAGPDTYQYRVAALDTEGRSSVASATTAIYHAAASGSATQLEWQSSQSPHVTGYRVYARKGVGEWVYFDTGSTTPSFLHSTMSFPTGTANPPDHGDESTQIRLGLSLGVNGPITHRSAVVRPRIANGQWEWLRLSSEVLAPLPVPLGVAQPDYRLVVEAKHPTGGDGLAVDVVAFAPSDEAWFDATATALAAPREWVLGTNEGGHSYAFHRDPDNTADVRGANVTGTLAIGPGDVKVLFMLRGGNETSVVEDASAVVQLTMYPRYRWAAGSQ